jgi:hypothetical protein
VKQLYGTYWANLAAKEHAKAMGIEYRYKARLRPDTAFVTPFPNIETIRLENLDSNCPSKAIIYPNRVVFGHSGEDSFNFGKISQHCLSEQPYERASHRGGKRYGSCVGSLH